EEVEVGLDQVKLQQAPPNDALYANALLRAGEVPYPQRTGLSASIRAFWTPLRQAGAVARTLLIAAAAKQWRVEAAVCRAKHGVVSAGSRRPPYGPFVGGAPAPPGPAIGHRVATGAKDVPPPAA